MTKYTIEWECHFKSQSNPGSDPICIDFNYYCMYKKGVCLLSQFNNKMGVNVGTPADIR